MSIFQKVFFWKKNKLKKINVIYFDGIITSKSTSTSNIHSRQYLAMIEKAFSKKSCDLVALVINSPGGSPTQSMIIGDVIRRCSEKSKIPVIAFCEDVAASGGYWIAVAADKVYALPTSIIGSIGVVYSSFGFQQLIKKLGIERRVETAGKNKAILDPFKPYKEFDLKHLQKLQKSLHKVFINYVKQRRKNKHIANKTEKDDVFSGLFWLGEEALELGLIDGLGSMNEILNQKYGKHLIKTIKKSWFSSLGSSSWRKSGVENVITEITAWDIESRFKI